MPWKYSPGKSGSSLGSCPQQMDKTIEKVGTSRFWSLLWTRSTLAPSVALCRVPELEYAATLDVTGRVLDHCCGDGMFASLAWPEPQVVCRL